VDEKGRRENRLSKTEIKEFNAEVVPRALEERKRLGFSTSDDLVYPYGKTKSDVNYSKDGLYACGFYVDGICFVPWLHMFIAWDGSIYTCCMMNGRMEPLGNAGKSDVGDVFEGEPYRNLRSRFIGERFEYCAACDDFLKENELLNACLNRTLGPLCEIQPR
jgi:MoaA/NifB/PqqE/SkfB family radical SAM enzyme